MREPLRIEGEMTIYSAAALAERVTAAIAGAVGRPTLDLSQVTEIDTAGLQILLMARKLARPHGGLALLEPSPRVLALLRLCRLEDMVEAGANPQGAS
jgi:anti-sigma B factor antagonist